MTNVTSLSNSERAGMIYKPSGEWKWNTSDDAKVQKWAAMKYTKLHIYHRKWLWENWNLMEPCQWEAVKHLR